MMDSDKGLNLIFEVFFGPREVDIYLIAFHGLDNDLAVLQLGIEREVNFSKTARTHLCMDQITTLERVANLK